MKVMHIASGDLWAGAEVQLFHLARSLVKEKDIQLLVVLLNHGQLERELINQGISVTVFDEEQVSGFSIFKSIYKLIKDTARCVGNAALKSGTTDRHLLDRPD